VYSAPRSPDDWTMFVFWVAEIFVHGGYFCLSHSATPDEVISRHRIDITRSAIEPLFDLYQKTIDQHIFEHEGVPYMYCTNHNAAARGIYVVQLAPDLNGTIGPHTRIVQKLSDETLIESPWLVARGGIFYLLFSANGADTADRGCD
jgi:hypothetical protein